MKRYDEICEEGDAATRKKHGWCSMAWIGINFATPRDEHEKWALAKVKEVFPRAMELSIYKVVELLAQVRRANVDGK